MRLNIKRLLALLAVFLLAVPTALPETPAENSVVQESAVESEGAGEILDADAVIENADGELSAQEVEGYIEAELNDAATEISDIPTVLQPDMDEDTLPASSEVGDGMTVPGQMEGEQQDSEPQQDAEPVQAGDGQQDAEPGQACDGQQDTEPGQAGDGQQDAEPEKAGDGQPSAESKQACDGQQDAEPGQTSEGEAGEGAGESETQDADEDPEDDSEANAAGEAPERLLNVQSMALGVKERLRLMVGGRYVGAGSGYWFTSSNGAIVAVNGATGEVLGRKVGTAVITLVGEDVQETCVVVVRKAPRKVTLNVKKLTLGAGQSFRLTGALTRNTASALYFFSSNNGVATVNGSGVITAHRQGTATITVKTFNGKKARCKLTVKPAPTYVTFGRAEVLLGVGQASGVGVAINPGAVAGISYASADPGILQVSGSWVRGAAVGETTLTATTHNGLTATVKVRVLPAPTSLTLPQYTIYMGKKEKLFLRPAVDAGSTSSFSFATSKKKVATVNGAGMVTAKKKGTAVITIQTYNGLTARCTIVVVNVPKKVSLAPGAMTIGVGLSGRLYASLPRGTGSAVSFYSSNPGIATVDGGGTVWGISAGTVIITARTFNGKIAQSRVTVLPAPTSVQIALGSSRIDNGSGTTISAWVNSGAAGDVTLTADPAEYVTISGGRVTAKASGLAVGEHLVTITGTTYNGVSSSVELTIVVRNRYRALLIGEKNIAGYPVCGRNEGDVRRMRSMLESIHGPTGERYEITTKLDLSTSAVKQAIDTTFANSSDADVSLFFIATHGDADSSGDQAGQLVLAGGANDILTLPRLAEWLTNVPGKVIVIVEACGSGAAVKESATAYSNAKKGARGATSAESAEDSIRRFNAAVVNAFSAADPGIVVSASQASLSGMRKAQRNGAAFVKENKFYVLTASDYQEDSWGVENTSNGETAYNYFTRWLTEGVGTSGSMPADTFNGNGDGSVVLQELYDYIVSVGNNFTITYVERVDGQNVVKYAYQHVQVYPAGSDYPLFSR